MNRRDLALAALASAAVPGMKPVAVSSVLAVTDGGGPPRHEALVEDVTGRRWIVRASAAAADGAELERYDGLVRLLGRHVPFTVPVAAGYADLGHGGRAAVYPHIDATMPELRNLPAGPGLSSAIGRAIAAIHNMAIELFEQMDVPVFDAATHRERALAELDRAAETGVVPTGLLARWEQAYDAAPLWHFAPTPVHGSLDGDAILVDFTTEEAESARVVAVRNWERALVTDPAVDFAEIVRQASRDAWETLLESYSMARTHRPDPYLTQRARLAGETRPLQGLAAAVDRGEEESVQRRVEALRRLDRLTSGDDSLVPRTVLPAAVAPTPEPAADESPADEPPGTHPAGQEPDDSLTDVTEQISADELYDLTAADPDVEDPDVEDPDADDRPSTSG